MNNKKQTSTTTPDYKAMLKDLGAPIIKAIGGRAKAMEQAKLMQALLHFKAKSGYNDLENIVAYALIEYKANLIEHGYRKYDKNYLPIVMNYGDAIDLCGLWLIHHTDKYNDIMNGFTCAKTNISQKDRDKALQLVKSHANYIEPNRHYGVSYDTLTRVYKQLEKQFERCKDNLNAICLYFSLYEADTRLIDTINFLHDINPGLKANEAQIAQYLKKENIINEGGKWVAKNLDRALDGVRLLVEPYERKLTHLKAMVIALERWVEQNNMEIFTPMRIRSIILDIKNYTHIALTENYYKSYILHLLDTGAEVTPEIERLAIVPNFDDVATDENDVNTCIEQIKEKYIEIQKQLR